MEMLKSMKEILMSQAYSQMNHLDKVDAKELGEVIDMIKDIEEAIYYCAKTKKIAHELQGGEHEIFEGHKTEVIHAQGEMTKTTTMM